VADVFSKRKRSQIMSRIRSSGSKPERVLRTLVREVTGRSLRYNLSTLPGSPDVVVHSMRLVLFMDGCLWHACPVHGRVPKSNVDFWKKKLEANVRRDRRTRSELRRAGWTVWAYWEHELRSKELPRTRRNMRRRILRLLSRL
jgi:DNA mismatch endonuclease (patch repair protein)